jgi:hypothetical protein
MVFLYNSSAELYSYQKLGFLRLHTFNNRMLLYDEARALVVRYLPRSSSNINLRHISIDRQVPKAGVFD